MIYFRNKQQDRWAWDSSVCAEISAGMVNPDKSSYQFFTGVDNLGQQTLGKFVENSHRAMKLLAEYGIEGASLDQAPCPYLAEEITCLTLTNYATFMPLLHAIIRAVRDNENYKWALLETAARVMATQMM
jgi:hypothetical protein